MPDQLELQEVRPQMQRREGAAAILARRKKKAESKSKRIPKDALSAHAIKVLAAISDLDRAQRRRVLIHAAKMNAVK